MNRNFFCDLHEQIQLFEEKIFLDMLDDAPITYGDADVLTAKLANRLAESGLVPGDRLCAQVKKSTTVVILYLACLRAGVIYLPLNTAYVSSELNHFFQDAEPAMVICDSEKFDEISKLATNSEIKSVLTLDANGNGTLMDGIDKYSASQEVAVKQSDDVALLIYTSGTTGKPKGSMITHGNIRTNAHALNQLWEWCPEDVLLHVLPLFHVHGLFNALHSPMLKASRIIFRKEFSVRETIELIPQATVLMAVPTIYSRLVSSSLLTKELCKNFRLFISGSAPLLPQTFEVFEEKTGHRILERYGMTEAVMITSNPVRGKRIAGTVGKALADVKLRVCDDEGNVLKPGEIGVLEIKGPNVFKGYWRNEEVTKKAIRKNGYFVSGDLATIDENGIVSIVGRKTDLIISAGFNIYPAEVEEQLNQIPGVKESAIFGVPHIDLGEAVVAVIVLNQGGELSESDVIEQLGKHLSSFKLPRTVKFVSELPTNAMGKVEKKKLRVEYNHLFNID